ncbi:MAG: adenine-specific methyltransferase EcoRI family protein [Muribaculaceae bacterium]|nr:adenine-specific methyltransferase EcoRI family protein [Muribaculaceae bacterium]
MANANLSAAKRAKNDEFYTQWHDIEVEMMAYLNYDPDVFRGKTVLLPCDDPEWSNFTKFFAQNFDRFGLKKLISTSYAPASKRLADYRPSLFEQNSLQYDELKSQARGKIFVLDNDITGDGRINIDDLQWQYLEGDGDFRSDEVTRLRDESDIIITNPPFSLFREFVKWIEGGNKQFIIIGNVNAVSYSDIFNMIKTGKIWMGCTIHSGDRKFGIPDDYPLNAAGCGIDENGLRYIMVKGVRWFTNIDHGRRHHPLTLMTMDDNLRFSRHKDIRERGTYQHYDNYDAIEVPYTDAIPSDYNGAMGVPITFLDKYCPEQFEILDANSLRKNESVPIKTHGLIKDKDSAIDGKPRYVRIVIRHKR